MWYLISQRVFFTARHSDCPVHCQHRPAGIRSSLGRIWSPYGLCQPIPSIRPRNKGSTTHSKPSRLGEIFLEKNINCGQNNYEISFLAQYIYRLSSLLNLEFLQFVDVNFNAKARFVGDFYKTVLWLNVWLNQDIPQSIFCPI